MKDLNTSVQMAGVAFKTPILVSSSEWASSPPLLEQLIQKPIGGIVTKTFTTRPEHRIRVRPYQFPLGASTPEKIDNALFVLTHRFARPRELSPNTGHGHHWYGNAESYFLVGNALGEGMKKLLIAQEKP